MRLSGKGFFRSPTGLSEVKKFPNLTRSSPRFTLRHMSPPLRVRSGLECLQEQGFRPLHGLRVGLVTHPAAVDAQLRHSSELLADAPGVRLAALFGPEHGLTGEAQDLIGVRDGHDPHAGLRVHSLYGDTVESLRPTEAQLQGLDALVIDLQDVGSRYYTFQATMLFCLE